MRRQRDVLRLKSLAVAVHHRLERRIDDALDVWRRAKAGVKVRAPRASRLEQVPDLLVRLDVGSAEAVNRLLRIADEKQLARHRPDAAPVAFSGIVGREQQQDLRLERIGVLKLVDEQMREARLKGLPHSRMADQQIARAQQQIDKIERARALLEVFV